MATSESENRPLDVESETAKACGNTELKTPLGVDELEESRAFAATKAMSESVFEAVLEHLGQD